MACSGETFTFIFISHAFYKMNVGEKIFVPYFPLHKRRFIPLKMFPKIALRLKAERRNYVESAKVP
jgi:predicted DNA-binding protein (MmcQ/YjbR family)